MLLPSSSSSALYAPRKGTHGLPIRHDLKVLLCQRLRERQARHLGLSTWPPVSIFRNGHILCLKDCLALILPTMPIALLDALLCYGRYSRRKQ